MIIYYFDDENTFGFLIADAMFIELFGPICVIVSAKSLNAFNNCSRLS